MNWIKALWDKLVSKTSTSPTLVMAEEAGEDCGEIFRRICNDAGVGAKRLAKVNAVELFEQWYEGLCEEQSIRDAIADFKLEHPGVAAKLNGKL